MKKKVSLTQMLDLLQQAEHYSNPQPAFNALLYGWRIQNKRSTAWLFEVRKRDLISFYLAKDFARYCLQKDWRKMMPE